MTEIGSAFDLEKLNLRTGSTYDICLHCFQSNARYFKILFRALLAFNFAAVNKFTAAINSPVTLYFFNSQVTPIT